MKILTLLLLVSTSTFSTTLASDDATVTKLHRYNAVYPASSALGIPFNGAIVTSTQLTYKKGEYWYSVDHLTHDSFFKDIEVLVRHDGAILGGRASFSGSSEEWSGDKGVKARLRVIDVFLGGEEDFETLMRKPIQVFNGSGDFGGMVFTFDSQGVTWRKLKGAERSVEYYEEVSAKVKSAHRNQ